MARRTEVLLDGLLFPEGPRWHDGRLWFSDMYAHVVKSVDLSGAVEVEADVSGQPSGLGWTPSGELLVVSMVDRRLLRRSPEGLVEVADLSALAPWHCNDMVVDARGRAYVGNFGAEPGREPGPLEPTILILVTPDGEAREVASELSFPNGSVITPDGATLVVGETFGQRLTAFDIAEDGSLAKRRVWATLTGEMPDGCCLDSEGAIWVASPVSHSVLRVREGGEILDRVEVETQAFACMLGGPQRKTLFVLTANSADPDACRSSPSGRIETVEVDVPGSGRP